MPAGSYWPRPWSCEDGGPRRLAAPEAQAGLAVQPGEDLELAAVRDAAGSGMLIRREPGELYLLRHELPSRPQGRPVRAWVEQIDPQTLDPLASSPRLPGGPFWPGGLGAHSNGDLYLVFGHWAHRLSPSLDVLASHRLPVDRPHNSFVALDAGELVDEGLRCAGRHRALHDVGARSAHPAAGRAAAVTARAQHRPPGKRRHRRDRGRHHAAVPDRARPRRRASRDRRGLAAALRPGAGPQLWLGPGALRRACLLDGQRPQRDRYDDARFRFLLRSGQALVDPSRQRRDSLGRDQRVAVRHGVEPARLGSDRPRSRRLRRRQRGATRLAHER